jgi:hypothetical protein
MDGLRGEAMSDAGDVPPEIAARISAMRTTHAKWPYVAAAIFVAVCGGAILILANSRSHTPFCNVAWDAWTTLDGVRAGRTTRASAVDRVGHDLASMRFHLDALERNGETRAVKADTAIVNDTTDALRLLEKSSSVDYTHYAIQDMPIALQYGGCRGPSPQHQRR